MVVVWVNESFQIQVGLFRFKFPGSNPSRDPLYQTKNDKWYQTMYHIVIPELKSSVSIWELGTETEISQMARIQKHLHWIAYVIFHATKLKLGLETI